MQKSKTTKWSRLKKRIVYLITSMMDAEVFCLFIGVICRKLAQSLKNIFTFSIETVNVVVEEGELRGRRMNSVFGKPYCSFLGIPYAKPPVGPLRFKDPEPPEKWNGVKDALRNGDVCIHKDFITGMVKGSENCLFLNVFTPQLPVKDVISEPKAVMFWIHGGGFQLGSGNNEVYGPDLFINEDIILVTINYRLGAIGFLGTGTPDAPGNAGLKDMVMALKWVKRNISAFGGDPNKVTIFGESAGAASVQYLLLSPTAKGLFQGAISQSGSAACPWAFNPNALESTQRLGRAFGFDSSDPKVLVDSLRKIPAKVIATKQIAAMSEQNKRECIPFEFVPCAEPENSPNAFITKNPRELIAEGKIGSDVPYITGINEMEGMVLIKSIIDKRPPESVIDKDFERVVPRFLKLQYGSEASQEVATKLRTFYFKGKAFDKKTHKEYIDLMTDAAFAEGVNFTTKYHLKYMKSPIYNYLFTFEGESNIFKKLLNVKHVKGAAHADDVFYMFHSPILGTTHDEKRREVIFSKIMVRLWSNFAKYGNPTPDKNDPLIQNMVWPPADRKRRPYLELNDNLSSCVDFIRQRMEFWDDLLEYSKKVTSSS